MEENPIEISTRVVLTEKAPFWVDVFYDYVYDNDRGGVDYYGTYLVRACVSSEGGTSNTVAGASIFDCYIIVEGDRKGSFVIKTYCKRIRNIQNDTK